jgi:hypothetical protein
MSSPFPGMDPYLESRWSSVHVLMMGAITATLNKLLPGTAYPISVRQRLPVIAIPLREQDADVSLDLQAVMQRVYQDGPFASIDYRKPPAPPLRDADAEWASRLAAPKK